MSNVKIPEGSIFLVYTVDKAGCEALRAENRADHIAFMKTIADRALIGGPLLTADGQARNGGAYLMKANSLEEARSIASGDPYVKCGLFETFSVRQFKWQTNNL